MAHTRDLYKTKLCTLYQRGNCPRQSCSFAHGDAELRRFSSAMGGTTPFSEGTDGHIQWSGPTDFKPAFHTNSKGRGEAYRSGDLRERLERRRSPPLRRRSPARDFRNRPGYYDRNLSPRDRGARSRTRTPPLRRRPSRSLSAQRSTPQKSKREVKRVRHDTVDAQFSDVSGEGHGTDDVAADGDFRGQMERTPSPTNNDTMENQLRQIQTDYEELLNEKAKLQYSLDKKTRESSDLLSQNQDLESRLHGATDDYKRLGMKMKMFLKYYARYMRAKDVASKTQQKLHQLAEELTLEDGEGMNAEAGESDVDVGSDAELKHPIHHVAGMANNIRSHERVVVSHMPVSTPATHEDCELGALVARRAVPTFVRQPNRGSEEQSDTQEAGREHSGSKLQMTGTTVIQSSQRLGTRPMVHQNGYRNTEVDDGDWSARPSVRLSLAATDKSEKDEVKEEFFVPLESKPGRRVESDMPMSSRSPPVEKVKVREVMSLPSTATSSHAREFDLERRIPLQGPVEMNGPDGEGVNVSLSLSSRAYGSVTANEPLGSLLPHSLSISSSHYNQFKHHGEDLDMSVGVSGDMSDLRDSSGQNLLVESSSLQQ